MSKMKAVLVADWNLPEIGEILRQYCRSHHRDLHIIVGYDFEEADALLRQVPIDVVVSQPALVLECSQRLSQAITTCDPAPGVVLWHGITIMQHEIALRLGTRTLMSLLDCTSPLEPVAAVLLGLSQAREESKKCLNYTLKPRETLSDGILRRKHAHDLKKKLGSELKVIHVGHLNGMFHDIDSTLRDWGLTVRSTTSGQKALEDHLSDPADIVVTNLYALQMNGLHLRRAIKKINMATPVVVYSNWLSMKHSFRNFIAEVDGYIDLPFSASDLRSELFHAAKITNSMAVTEGLRSVHFHATFK